MAPGTTASFRLIVDGTDGTQHDLSGQATWTSSNPNVLLVAPGGFATAVQEGEARAAALFPPWTVTKVISVLRPGTWSVKGTVADAGFGLSGARVEVVSGIGAGKTATTDAIGDYRLYGIAGVVQIRASLSGYEDDTRSITVNANQTQVTFTLRPSVAPTNLSGDWQFTVETNPECDSIPEIARRRTYSATIDQEVSALVVRLSDAEFAPDPFGLRGDRRNHFHGWVLGDSVVMKLTDEYTHDIGEILPDGSLLTMAGNLTGTATASSISGSLDGTIYLRAANADLISGVCDRSGAGQFTFVRRSAITRR
jgi:hypothetical protein